MSATRKNIYGATPSTTRGKPIHLGGDPKGKNFLYTCGNAVFIRNLEDPLQCDVYYEHQFQTTVARYAPSGFYIASADVSGTVRIWDTTQKEHILKLEIKVMGGPVLDLQWSDDSKRIVACGDGKEKFGAVFLWDTGSSVGEISGHSKCITSCDFKQTRPYRVATGSEDFLTCWLEGPPFKFKKSMKDQTRFINCVRFSPDGNKLISVSSDKSGIFYDGKTGDKVGQLSGESAHTAGILSCSWSPDSKKILTASADKTCKLWDDSGSCLKTFNVSENPQVEDQQVGTLWVGNTVLSVSLSGDINYLDLDQPNLPKRVVRGHNKFVTALVHDTANNHFYSASYDGVIVRWEVNSGATEAMVGKGHTNQVNKLYIQGSNLVSCAMDDTVRITPLDTRKYGDAISLDGCPADIAVGKKDTKLIVAALVNGFVVVIRDGKVVNKHQVKYQPSSVALSVDDTTLAVGAKDNSIYIYSISGDKLTEKTTVKGHRGAVSGVSFSPDGKHLASCDWNREILVWDTTKFEAKVSGWVFHNARVNSINWSPDSTHIVSSSLDSHLYVWNVNNPEKRIHIKDAHHGGANCAVFLDDNNVTSCGQDCTLKSYSLTY